MSTKFNFNSQICTNRNQSERLLALGLKKETADCYHWQETEPMYGEATGVWHLETLDSHDNQEHFEYLDKYFGVCLADDEEHYFIPAWSLHRLIEMMPKSIHFENEDWYKIIYNNSVCYQRGQFSICCSRKGDLYADIINCIEWLIKEGNFPEEYLEQ